MTRSILTLGFTLLAGLNSAMADDGTATKGDFDRAFEFVEQHLIGKTFETSISSEIQGGEVSTEFHRRRMFLNLQRSENAASYDVVILIRQQLWDMKDGQRTGEPRTTNRAIAMRYEFSRSKSTGEAIGLSRVLTSSVKSPVGLGASQRMYLNSGKLIRVQDTPVYGDGYAAAGSYKPTATLTTTTYTVSDNTVSINQLEQGFDVNPATRERTLSGHHVELNETPIDGMF